MAFILWYLCRPEILVIPLGMHLIHSWIYKLTLKLLVNFYD